MSVRRARGRGRKRRAFHLAWLLLLPLGVLFYQVLARAQADTMFREAAERGDLAAIRLFLAHGGNPNASDGFRWSALLWAAGKGQRPAVELLLDRGADPNRGTLQGRLREMDGWTPSSVVSGIKGLQGKFGPQRIAGGMTPLMAAAGHGHNEVVALLLQRGANPSLRDGVGDTARDYAQNAGDAETKAILATR